MRLGFRIGSKNAEARSEGGFILDLRDADGVSGKLEFADRQSRVECSVISIHRATEVADYKQSPMVPLLLV